MTSHYYYEIEALAKKHGLYDPTKGGNGELTSAAWGLECARASAIERNLEMKHMVQAAVILLERVLQEAYE